MNEVDTTIGSMVKITGNITSEGNVIIHGSVEKGEVKIGGHLTVGESAKITGNISADSVTVLGNVIGNISCENDLEIGSTGRVQGDLKVGNEFVVERGGVFLGKSVMPDHEDDTDEYVSVDEEEPQDEE
jgi:cytoskeletal protein CcmA (bactofilin family)